MIMALFLINYYSNKSMSMLIFILLMCVVDNGYLHLLLVKFFVNKLIICQDTKKKRFLLCYLKNILNQSLRLLLDLLLIDFGLICTNGRVF